MDMESINQSINREEEPQVSTDDENPVESRDTNKTKRLFNNPKASREIQRYQPVAVFYYRSDVVVVESNHDLHKNEVGLNLVSGMAVVSLAKGERKGMNFDSGGLA